MFGQGLYACMSAIDRENLHFDSVYHLLNEYQDYIQIVYFYFYLDL